MSQFSQAVTFLQHGTSRIDSGTFEIALWCNSMPSSGSDPLFSLLSLKFFLTFQVVDNKVRFGLTKLKYDPPTGFTEESTQVVFTSHDLDLDLWELPQKFEDEHFKGLKFSKKALINVAKGNLDEFF
jgi:hypothetical protein